MSISTQNSPVEKKITSPENTKLKTETEKESNPWWKKFIFNSFDEICPLEKDEERERKYQDPTVLGHGYLVILQIVLVGCLSVFFTRFAFWSANSWMKELEDFNSNKTIETVLTQENGQTPSTENNSNITINKAQLKRINQQFKETKIQAKTHYNIMKDLSKKRYVAMSMALVLGSISFLCLILISRLGWERSHKGIINIFMITTAFAIFYGDITNVYQHEKNITFNEDKYEEYIDLGNYILSYLVAKNDTNGEEKNPEEFIYKVDSRMEELNDIGFIFDNKSIDKKLAELNSFRSVSEQPQPKKTGETEQPQPKKTGETEQQPTGTESK